MGAIVPLENPVQTYAWGSRTAIPNLLGVANPNATPQAELWIGAHPKSPSIVKHAGTSTPLDRYLLEESKTRLGAAVAAEYGALPFLLKVLAADEPLSIQCHPSREQARAGFQREDADNIPLDDPTRNFRDHNHKPELICALSSFRALEGFRPLDTIAADLTALAIETLAPALARFETNRDLEELFTAVMESSADEQREAAEAAAERAASLDGDSFEWIVRLAERYPGDVGVLAPVFLNLVELEQDEALFLGAGQLHAYLGGVGIEIMASSDNVIRGGLTPKHVDVPELLRTVNFEPSAPNVLRPKRIAAGTRVFETPAPDFVLTIVDLTPETPHEMSSRRSVEIIFCADGAATIHPVDDAPVRIGRGRAVLVSAEVSTYTIDGSARLYKAGVG